MADTATLTKEQIEAKDDLLQRFGAYISDLAVVIERETRQGVADESVSLIHAAALRVYELAGGIMGLSDNVELRHPARALESAEDLLKGPDAARARSRARNAAEA
ncbi:MAG: hypothetical protein KIT17_15395 [Rubrivivax sp.]|nr:hypothetical protein [Rubrivivax sp.]